MALLLAVAGGAYACHRSQASIPEPGAALTYERIGSDVVVARDSIWESNMVGIRTDEGLLIVDSFVEWETSAVAAATLGRMLGDRRIAAVVNTHWHDDHSFGNQGFADAPIYGAAPTVQALTTHVRERQRTVLRDGPGILRALDDTLARPNLPEADRARITSRVTRVRRAMRFFTGLRITPPNRIIGDTTISVGGLDVELIHRGPAHTRGDVAVLVPARRLLMIGDLGGRSTFVRVDDDGNTANWIALLDTIKSRSAGRVDVVISGHQAPGDMRLVTDTRDLLREVHDSVAYARRAGWSLEATRSRVQLVHLRHLALYDLFREMLIDAAWREQEVLSRR